MTTAIQRTVLVLGRRLAEPALLSPEDLDGSTSIVVIAVGWPLTDAQHQAVEAARAVAQGSRLAFDAMLVGSFAAGVEMISGRDRVLLGADRREARRLRRLLQPRLITARVAR